MIRYFPFDKIFQQKLFDFSNFRN